MFLLRRYDAALHRRPLLVKACTSGCINALADTTIQVYQGQKWDVKRTAIYGGVYGGLWYGPFMHTVTTMWGRMLPSTSLPSLAFKSAVDVCTSLALNLSLVIGLQAYCRGENVQQTVHANHWNSWKTAVCYWPAANMLVYRMPVIYRVLTLNTASFFWNCGMICFFCRPPTEPSGVLVGSEAARSQAPSLDGSSTGAVRPLHQSPRQRLTGGFEAVAIQRRSSWGGESTVGSVRSTSSVGVGATGFAPEPTDQTRRRNSAAWRSRDP